jgi:hypothetical protein
MESLQYKMTIPLSECSKSIMRVELLRMGFDRFDVYRMTKEKCILMLKRRGVVRMYIR